MTDVYCAIPGKIGPFFERRGFQSITLVASEGMFADEAGDLKAIRTDEPERFSPVWILLLKTADEPSILGSAAHLLYVGRKIEDTE